jgi:hypothetical protein
MSDPVEFGKRVKPDVPPGAVIVVADAAGNTDRAMKGPVHTWTWLGAETWYYAAEIPVPAFGKAKVAK